MNKIYICFGCKKEFEMGTFWMGVITYSGLFYCEICIRKLKDEFTSPPVWV